MAGPDRILFVPPVHWNYYPYRDQELPAALARKGYECIYLNPVAYRGSENAGRFRALNPRVKPPGLHIVDRSSRLRKSFLELLAENVRNAKALHHYHPDAVISTDHLMSAFLCLACRRKGIPFIFDVTDNWELVDSSVAGRLYKWIIKGLLGRRSYAITCSSQQQFDYFKRKNQRSYLIPNAINPALLARLDALSSVTPDRAEVNFIGSLRDWYNFELLIDVFSHFPSLTLNIWGDGPLLPGLKTRTAAIPNIHCHGSIPNDQSAELLKRSLFGILPLHLNELNQSTCPIKLFDYWGASKAVISTPVKEVKRLGGSDILYAESRSEFIQAIKKLLDDKTLRLAMGRAGRKKIDEAHNYQHITREFIQIL